MTTISALGEVSEVTDRAMRALGATEPARD